MLYRELGATGLSISEIGFGCGNVGGLMIRGDRPERTRTVARAIELGINYFDTAAMYGNRVSEENLGQTLNELQADVHVGTKVRLTSEEQGDIKGGILRSMDESLRRMGRDSVDLIQLHNSISSSRKEDVTSLTPQDVCGEVVEAFEELRAQGKARHYGITGVGETGALLQVVDSGMVSTVQTPYNLINPSAGYDVTADFPHQNYARMIDRAASQGKGIIVIRVMAGGALGGLEQRHALASPSPAPIASGSTYQQDLEAAQTLSFLVQEGYADSLAEAAIRFPLGTNGVSTVLVGYSSMEQMVQSVAFEEKGPLPAKAMERLQEIRGWDTA